MASEQIFTNNIDDALERLLAPVAEVERLKRKCRLPYWGLVRVWGCRV